MRRRFASLSESLEPRLVLSAPSLEPRVDIADTDESSNESPESSETAEDEPSERRPASERSTVEPRFQVPPEESRSDEPTESAMPVIVPEAEPVPAGESHSRETDQPPGQGTPPSQPDSTTTPSSGTSQPASEDHSRPATESDTSPVESPPTAATTSEPETSEPETAEPETVRTDSTSGTATRAARSAPSTAYVASTSETPAADSKQVEDTNRSTPSVATDDTDADLGPAQRDLVAADNLDSDRVVVETDNEVVFEEWPVEQPLDREIVKLELRQSQNEITDPVEDVSNDVVRTDVKTATPIDTRETGADESLIDTPKLVVDAVRTDEVAAVEPSDLLLEIGVETPRDAVAVESLIDSQVEPQQESALAPVNAFLTPPISETTSAIVDALTSATPPEIGVNTALPLASSVQATVQPARMAVQPAASHASDSSLLDAIAKSVMSLLGAKDSAGGSSAVEAGLPLAAMAGAFSFVALGRKGTTTFERASDKASPDDLGLVEVRTSRERRRRSKSHETVAATPNRKPVPGTINEMDEPEISDAFVMSILPAGNPDAFLMPAMMPEPGSANDDSDGTALVASTVAAGVAAGGGYAVQRRLSGNSRVSSSLPEVLYDGTTLAR